MNMHLLIIVTSLLFVFIFNSFFVVQQQTCVIVERLGKFQRIAKAGLNFKIPFLETIKSTMSLRIHQLDVDVETKTKDNVFVRMIVVVQYKILETKIFEACYTLHDPVEQIKAFVFDLVRAQIPLMELDDVFSKKDDVANAVRNELRIPMSDFGYEIIKTLVTDIDPDAQVKTAMNEINTAQRMRVAANERGEAEKILKVKQAEAEAEASILHGKGVAGQRRAIIEGLRESVDSFVKSTGSTANNVMDMVIMIQYIDTLKEIGGHSKSNVIFVPHSPSCVNTISEQLRETIFAADSLKSFKN